ncbi:hypothetical protein SLS62_011394 [Diatrype stigma]|uniref:Uncharacterized protein n=1 Tax=Diatrype stigma TaxID=117547 RepID=A0AAN9UAW5_9PEZI
MPQFGATFYPGGVDDFYMPEVVAPAPQRAVGGAPQLPTAINTSLGGFGHQYQQQQPQTDYSPASGYGPTLYSAATEQSNNSFQPDRSVRDIRDAPSFSPFPKVTGDHIPPSDDEKEAVLAESRHHVLHSNDPNMQICWARDVLAYVEIAAEAAIREADAARRPGEPEPTTRPATPKIEHELRLDAINIVSYLADQGHPEATFIRSKWLEFGKFGRRQDKKEAYSGYQLAAQQGWGRADYRIGMLYENSNDMESALRHYNMGLSTNDSAASYRLGMINLMGQRGQPKDLARGLELISSAADTADEDAPQGAFVYGMLIARDLPDVTIPEGALPYDVGIARQYVEKAAYLGFAKAQLKMGQAYELCQLGCDFNPALSLHYYGLAARQGQPEACLGVSRWFLFGYEGTFAKNEQLAFKYAQLAAKAKLPTGEFAMGYYYEIGISVDKDLREARRWYELAAEHGNKDAVARLEGMSQSKTLSKADHETTAMSRIKSVHGSQRGKRPERFKTGNSAMPTLSEDNQASPRVSPHPSPRTHDFDHTDFPSPSQNGNGGDGRPPAFTVNLAERPKSAAPYPEDDRPQPLNMRPKSTAPYPEDDTMGAKPQMSPRYNPNIRPSSGPVADHPGSAFGIRQSPGYGPPGGMHPSQSAGQLAIPPAGTDPNRNRPSSAGWQPQVPGDYRQGSPGPQRQDMRPGYGQRPPQSGYDHRLPSNPAQNKPGPGGRLAKPNPNPGLPGQYPPAAGGYGHGQRDSSLPLHPQPGRDYAPGPRHSPRPSADRYDSYGSGGRPPASAVPPNMGPPVMSGGMGGMGPRTDSIPLQGGLPQGGPGGQRIGSGGSGRPGMPLKDRPTPLNDSSQGRSSAPPSSAQMRPPVASPTPSITTPGSAPIGGPAAAEAKPKPKPSPGPATFEQMGIPKVKKEDDCVVM